MVDGRVKGRNFEYETAKNLEAELGIKFKRDIEQYRQTDRGDLLADDPDWPFVIECKRYNRGNGCNPAWQRQATAAALAAGKVLMVKIDQKGCIYCEKVAKEILTEPAINSYVRENFVVVQLDLYGNRDVTDLDGTVMPESEMARRWGVLFTPTIYFISEPIKADQLPQAASAVMPGAFGKLTFLGMLPWVKTGAYKDEPRFQKYFGSQTGALRKQIEAARSS